MRQLLFLILCIVSHCSLSITITWNGFLPADSWNNPSNWIPAQVPTASDDVIINGGGSTLNITAGSPSVKSFTITSGTIQTNGANINVNGTYISNGGSIIGGGVIWVISSSFTSNGGTFNVAFNVMCDDIFLNGGTFNNQVYFQKNGPNDNISLGGGTYNSPGNQIANAGSGDMILASSNPDNFYSLTISNGSNNAEVRVADGSVGNVFGTLIIDNDMGSGPANPLRAVHIAKKIGSSASILNAINVYSNGSLGIFFGEGGGLTTFEAGASHSFIVADGTLSLKNVTSNILLDINAGNLSGTTSLILGPGSVLNQPIQAGAPHLFLNGATFNSGMNDLRKTGAGNDSSLGGNIFTASANMTLMNEGTGDLILGTATGDQFLGICSIVNATTNSKVCIAESSTGNSISGSVLFDNWGGVGSTTKSMHVCRQSGAALTVTGTLTLNNNQGTGIFFGENGGQTTFDSGTSVGSYGFVDGTLLFSNLTSNVSLDLNTFFFNDASFKIGPGSVFNQPIQAKAPHLFLNGATYNSGMNDLRKTGAGNDSSLGGNIFTGSATMTLMNQGTGDLILGTATGDQFLGICSIVNATTNSKVCVAESSTGNSISGSVLFDNWGGVGSTTKSMHVCRQSGAALTVTGTLTLNNNQGTGIFFGENGGQTTFNSGTSVGSYGFVDGTLLLANVTSNVNLSLTGIFLNDAALKLGPSSIFNQQITAYAPRLFLNGAIYNSLTELRKTGSLDDVSDGGNSFTSSGSFTIINQGSGDLILGGINGDQFNTIGVFANNTSSNQLRIAENSTGNVINANVLFDNATGPATSRSIHACKQLGAQLTVNAAIEMRNNGSTGVFFGQNGGVTTIGTSGSFTSPGFYGGTLSMANCAVNPIWTIPSSFMLNDAALVLGPSTTFNDQTDVSSPSVFLNGITCNDQTIIRKTGTLTDLSLGGNVYNDIVTLYNSNTGAFQMAGTSNDTYNDRLYITSTSTGNIDLCHTANALIYDNIYFTTIQPVVSSTNNGVVIFTGGNAQSLNNLATAIPVLGKFQMSKSGNDLTLNCPVNVSIEGDFVTGRIFSTTTNYLQFLDNAIASPDPITSNSFVNGPVLKKGNDFFVFPVGKGSRAQVCAIDAPANVTDLFSGEYFPSNSDPLYPHTSKVGTLNNISTCDYWMINRLNGTSNVNVWLSWNTPGCNGMTSLPDVVIARWDGTMWQDHGQGTVGGDIYDGYMSTASAVTSFSPFALASRTPLNPLPVELLSFEAKLLSERSVELNWTTASEINTDHFNVMRSSNGLDFELIGKLNASGNSIQEIDYKFTDLNPYNGVSYYQLITIDQDGSESASPIRVINYSTNASVLVYPNPVSENGQYSILTDLVYDHFQISDVTGRLLLSSDPMNIVPLSLPVGTYYMTLFYDNKPLESMKLYVSGNK